MDRETTIENALLVFVSVFEREGLGSAPDGLIQLLRSYRPHDNETGNEMRHRIYKRFFGILWYGSKKEIGKSVGDTPTYVYPEDLKKVVRALIPGDVRDYPDPTGPRVYQVTLKDLATAKWPVSKRTTSKSAPKKRKS